MTKEWYEKSRNEKIFLMEMEQNKIDFYLSTNVNYILYVVESIDRFVTFNEAKCKIGRKRLDGSISWADATIGEICSEIIWLFNYTECTGHKYWYSDKPWIYDLRNKQEGNPYSGQPKRKSRSSRKLAKIRKEQEKIQKAEEKERKRIEKFEAEIAKRTRKTNR